LEEVIISLAFEFLTTSPKKGEPERPLKLTNNPSKNNKHINKPNFLNIILSNTPFIKK
jgi:hypothetical protein